MHGLTSKAVNHLYAEWGKTTAVVGFGSEKADGRLDEGIKTFLGRKISLVAGHRRPEQSRAVDGVVARHTAHCRQLATDIILDPPEFLGIIAPRHDIAVAAHRGQAVRMCLIEIAVNPLLVDSVTTAVFGKTVHISRCLFKPGKVLIVVINQHILVVDMIARQQQSDGRGKTQSAIRSIR